MKPKTQDGLLIASGILFVLLSLFAFWAYPVDVQRGGGIRVWFNDFQFGVGRLSYADYSFAGHFDETNNELWLVHKVGESPKYGNSYEEIWKYEWRTREEESIDVLVPAGETIATGAYLHNAGTIEVFFDDREGGMGYLSSQQGFRLFQEPQCPNGCIAHIQKDGSFAISLNGGLEPFSVDAIGVVELHLSSSVERAATINIK